MKMMILCFTGRRFGTVKWPFAPNKSIAGSVGFVVAGFAVSVGLLALMNYTGAYTQLAGLQPFALLMRIPSQE